ncbi:MAG TPA: septum formation family protein [Mycobacterium sp.]|nr:septum formation family protein [Mycobacterium sp.]
MTVPPDPGYQGNPPPHGRPQYGPPPGGPAGAYPPPPPPPLPYQGFQREAYYAPAPRTNWWSIVALIFGVIGGVLISLICGIVGLKKSREYQRGRGMAIAALVLSVLWIFVIGAAILLQGLIGEGNVTATDVKVGDCLADIPDGDKVIRVQTVGCDQPHAGEVFAVITMPDGDFPGEAAVEAYHEKCGPELSTYSPAAMTDDSVQLYVLYPTADTWASGDRAVTCIATLDPPRTGSIKS